MRGAPGVCRTACSLCVLPCLATHSGVPQQLLRSSMLRSARGRALRPTAWRLPTGGLLQADRVVAVSLSAGQGAHLFMP